jgi:putative toxin-antitoxin system antitoxin component (TIGR02293 family)
MAIVEHKTPRPPGFKLGTGKEAVRTAGSGKKIGKEPRKGARGLAGKRAEFVALLRGRAAVKQDFVKLYDSSPSRRIDILKSGVPYEVADMVVSKSHVLDKQELLRALGLPRATYDRRIKDRKDFPASEGEKIVGFGRLIGQVEAMLAGNEDAKGFDARAWLSNWLRTPLPPLDHRKPVDLLDTVEGQNLVSSMLDRMALGVYA